LKVQPITDLRDIKNIKRMLLDKPRDKLLFTLGINAGLRVQDILNLKISDVRYLNEGDRIVITELKTGKENVIMINKEIGDNISEYLSTIDLNDEHYLFKSRKGYNSPLSTYAITKYVKIWTDMVNLKGNFGAHTLRKTWCYHQRKTFGVSWELISKRLNHASPSITRRYLGVKEEEVEEILMNVI